MSGSLAVAPTRSARPDARATLDPRPGVVVHPRSPDPRGLLPFLRRIAVFERVEEEALVHLAEIVDLQRLRRGATLWRAGEPAREVVWVRSGVIWLHRGQDTAREVSIGYYGRGALLGLHPGGAGASRQDDARVHQDAALLTLRRQAFDAWMVQHPSVVPAVLDALSARCNELHDRLALAAVHGAKARLAGLLLDLADDFGVRDGRGVIIDLRLTHRELAGLIGATRETVSVAMVELRGAGVIDTEARRVVLVDEDAVRSIAGR